MLKHLQGTLHRVLRQDAIFIVTVPLTTQVSREGRDGGRSNPNQLDNARGTRLEQRRLIM